MILGTTLKGQALPRSYGLVNAFFVCAAAHTAHSLRTLLPKLSSTRREPHMAQRKACKANMHAHVHVHVHAGIPHVAAVLVWHPMDDAIETEGSL